MYGLGRLNIDYINDNNKWRIGEFVKSNDVLDAKKVALSTYFSYNTVVQLFDTNGAKILEIKNDVSY